jgi:hypothetical protein
MGRIFNRRGEVHYSGERGKQRGVVTAMADVQKLKLMTEAVHQREQQRQEAADRQQTDEFQSWIQTTLSSELREALQIMLNWDERQQQPMATFELGRERGRIYKGNNESEELGQVVFIDPDGRETLSSPFHSEDELLLLIEKYL